MGRQPESVNAQLPAGRAPRYRRSGISPNLQRWASFLVLAIAISHEACDRSSRKPHGQIAPIYDSKTGRLQLLKLDSNGNGRIDTWSYMDGSRVVRIELDQNEDGKIDRWEYYDEGKHLTKIGYSRSDSGQEDAWSYADANGEVVKVELSGKDGRIRRTEHYDRDHLTTAEEDTDGDGRIDKWETYGGGRLLTVAFDTTHRGTPERRLVYGADGSARVETVAP
jgi:hypothetical protein